MVSLPFACAAILCTLGGVVAATLVDMRRGDRGFYLVWALLLAAIVLAILGLEVHT